MDSFAARTSDLLNDADIPVLLIKGPATSRRLYPTDPNRRRYSDVDLLVPPDRFDDTEEVLRVNDYQWNAAGTRNKERPWHESSWRAAGPAHLALDLHRGFAGVTDPAQFFRSLWASRDSIELCGTHVFVPSVPGTALILTLHAACPGRALKPLGEIQRAHEFFPPAVWQAAAELSRSSGSDSAFRAGLGLLPGGAELADQLGVGGVVTADQWLAGRQHDRVSVSLAQALAEPDIMSATAHVLRRVVPSPAFIRLSDAGARRGPVGLAMAYGRRALRAITGAPRALLDIMTARKALRAGSKQRARFRRALSGVDARSTATAVWAFRAQRQARKQLRIDGLRELALSAPASFRAVDRSATVAALRVSGASCLERSVVLQRFDAAAGRPRDVIIGVTAPGGAFRAHAWLQGELQRDTALHEITRRPAPPEWSPARSRPAG